MFDKLNGLLQVLQDAKKYADQAADALDVGADALEKVVQGMRTAEDFIRQFGQESRTTMALPPGEQDLVAACCDKLQELQVECEVGTTDVSVKAGSENTAAVGPIAQLLIAAVIKNVLERLNK